MNRREFLVGAGCASLFSRSLWAAMKYDRNAVTELFRLRAEETDARVKAGIEANRKGSMMLRFVDAAGKPLENVHVKLRQKTHDFKYGADIFMLDEIVDDTAKNEAYKERFAEIFNLATCPFYWDGLEPEEGKTRYGKNSPRLYRRPPPDLCVEWCKAHGIEPKAHCLNYANTHPNWAKGDVGREKYLLEKRFAELSARYAKDIPWWEVTNETFWRPSERVNNFYAQPDFVEWSFKLAEKYFPANKLVINEAHCCIWDDTWFHGSRSPYYMQIERALLKGARIDGIGMQFHMFHGQDMKNVIRQSKTFYDPRRIFDVMDTYQALGKPMHITEITIPAYSEDPGDEAVQAEVLRELYRIWFSHAAMEGIIYWNLPDGYAAYAEPGDFKNGENAYYGGLCRFDMSPKPAFHVIKDLFGREWRTSVDTEAAGRYVFRGFYGKYDAEFTSKGRTVRQEIHLSKDLLKDVKVVV